ncbi:hypothetical protein CIB84_016645, partial [Bambusicola thoracicus]
FPFFFFFPIFYLKRGAGEAGFLFRRREKLPLSAERRAAGPDVSAIYTRFWGAIQDLHFRLYSRCFDRVALSNRPLPGRQKSGSSTNPAFPFRIKAFCPSPTESKPSKTKPNKQKKTQQNQKPTKQNNHLISIHTYGAVCIQTQKEQPNRRHAKPGSARWFAEQEWGRLPAPSTAAHHHNPSPPLMGCSRASLSLSVATTASERRSAPSLFAAARFLPPPRSALLTRVLEGQMELWEVSVHRYSARSRRRLGQMCWVSGFFWPA